MKKSRVTIRDVALVARVTPQTVSRAIRNAPEVSAETREKVLKVAAELNYVKIIPQALCVAETAN